MVPLYEGNQYFLNNLEYGKLYVFTCDAMRGDAYVKILRSSAVVKGGWMKLLQVEKVVVPEISNNDYNIDVDKLGLVVAARRFDTASIGNYAVIACVIPNLRLLDQGMQMFASKLFNMEADEKDTFLIISPDQIPDSRLEETATMLMKDVSNFDHIEMAQLAEPTPSASRVKESRREKRKTSLFKNLKERFHLFEEVDDSKSEENKDANEPVDSNFEVVDANDNDDIVIVDSDEEGGNTWDGNVGCAPAERPNIVEPNEYHDFENPSINYSFMPEPSMSRRSEEVRCCMRLSSASGEMEIYREKLKEEQNIEQLERERQNDLELIKNLIVAYIAKYHADPKELFAENVQGKYVVNEQPRVVVNGDLKVVLPELDETELKMEAASRTLYIWFLLHPQGCTRSELKTHRRELVNIYSMVKPGSNYPEACVNAVLNDATLTTNISRIKKVVKSKFLRDEVADKYYIKADNNGVYKIGIASDPQMVTMPRAITCSDDKK